MITKMKKLTLLVYHKEYEAFLEQMRALGVVHVVCRQGGEPDAALQEALQRLAACRKLAADMRARAGKEVAPAASSPVQETAEEMAARYEELQTRIHTLEARLPQLDKDIAALKPWGDFDPASLSRLDAAGWHVSFYACQAARYLPAWEDEWHAVRIREEDGQVWFVTVTPAGMCPDFGLEPLRLPSSGLSEVFRQCEEVAVALSKAQDELRDYCRSRCAAMERQVLRLQGGVDLMRVRLGGERMADGALVLLEGWIPADCEEGVRHLLDGNGVYYELRAARKDDNAPIKLRNNAFTRMYETLTRMYGMPDYGEFDPTPILAPFFSLFFAFCMGDAGYGLVLIALGLVLKKKMPRSMAGMMNLVVTLGVFTTVVGAVLGTFFGVSLFGIGLPQWMEQFMVVGKIDGTTYDKQMLLALLIGVVHICIAMTVKAVCSTARYGFKESLSAWGWLLLVVGFVCTGGLSFFKVISAEVSTWAFITIGGVAAIGIYLLNNLHRNVLLNIGAGVWDTYNMATGLLGDTLSYIRLYALGLAGGMLGGVFNQLAFMVNDAAGPALGWLFCGLILVFGHSLNIAMSCLSAFVHPLRLTFVEYFKNSGYEGKGEAYKPFAAVDER